MVNMVQNNVLPAISHDPHLSLEEVNRQLIGLVDKYINKDNYPQLVDKNINRTQKNDKIKKK